MATARETAIAAERQDVVTRLWLSTPALVIIFCAALGPLLVVLFYTFLTKGDYGGVKWIFSTDGWFSVFFERDIFDDTVSLADAHLSIFWRSVKLSLSWCDPNTKKHSDSVEYTAEVSSPDPMRFDCCAV